MIARKDAAVNISSYVRSFFSQCMSRTNCKIASANEGNTLETVSKKMRCRKMLIRFHEKTKISKQS